MLQTRIVPKLIRILTLAALLTTATPVCMRAQEPAAKPDATAKSPEAAKTEDAAKPKSQEEQDEAFRLEGPIVKWTAKTTGWSVNTSATVFDFLNFAILVFGVGIPLARIVPKVIRKRSETVRFNLEEARKASVDAAARMSAIESKLSGLDTEIAAIRAQVEQESAQDEVRIKASIEDEKTRIVASAEQEISVAAAHARRSLQNFAADLAIEQAAKQLILTPETDRALIDEFLNSVGGKN